MNKKYDIIYADPPWFYSKRSTERKTKFRGGARAHYILMRDDEIKALPVSDIASTNCALFLWAVAPKLDDAIDVMRAWGFDYREMYVWEKLNHKSLTPVFAPGYYMRPACEFLLMGIRGRMVPKTHSQSGLVRLPRQRHSEKPSLFREL
jgi:N6-adenosine-specific RNA methylase IME4